MRQSFWPDKQDGFLDVKALQSKDASGESALHFCQNSLIFSEDFKSLPEKPRGSKKGCRNPPPSSGGVVEIEHNMSPINSFSEVQSSLQELDQPGLVRNSDKIYVKPLVSIFCAGVGAGAGNGVIVGVEATAAVEEVVVIAGSAVVDLSVLAVGSSPCWTHPNRKTATTKNKASLINRGK